MEIDQVLLTSVQQGIAEGIKTKLSSHNSPLNSLIEDCLKQNDGKLRTLLNEALTNAFGDQQFRQNVIDGVSHKLSTLLVARFGGELEKQVNALKSDPSTRARITLAIEEIVKSKA
jgi:hypothetical protein